MKSSPNATLNVKGAAPADAVQWVKEGFELYKNNFGLLLLATLLTFIVSLCSFLLLFAPMAAGVYLIILRLRDPEAVRPSPLDVFSGFGYFGETFLFGIMVLATYFVGGWLVGLVPWIGGLLEAVFNFGVAAAMMFGLLFILDAKMSPSDAYTAGIQALKDNPGTLLVFALLVSLAAGCGVVLLGIGILLTMPLHFTSVGSAYFALSKRVSAGEAAAPVSESAPQSAEQSG